MKKATILAILALLAGLMAVPAVAEAGPAVQAPISGSITLIPIDDGETRVLPNGVIHQTGATAEMVFSGEIEGSMMCYYSQNTISATYDHLTAMCSTEGVVTWNDRTGPTTGRVTTECKADVPFEFYCDGVSVYHGSGDLDGVTFHITWRGPYPSATPFTYEGFALDTNR